MSAVQGRTSPVITMVTDVDYMGLTVKEKDGDEYRIECAVKVWSAGVQASPHVDAR